MPLISPPPREQVLSGLHAQAEQAKNLVEDLADGSAKAAGELLSLASQVLARARMFQWARAASWALAVEERLSSWPPGSPVLPSELAWLRRHVERFEQILEPSKAETPVPTGEPPLEIAEDELEVTVPRLASPSAEDLPSLYAPTTEQVVTAGGLDLDFDDLAAGPEEAVDEAPRPADEDLDLEVDVDERWFELDAMAREEAVRTSTMPEEPAVEDVAVEQVDTAASLDVELAGALEDELVAQLASLGEDAGIEPELPDDTVAEPAPVAASAPTESEPARPAPPSTPVPAEQAATAEFRPEIVEFMAKELDAAAAASEPSAEPKPSEAAAGLPPSEVPLPSEGEVKPTLGKLELQKVSRPIGRNGEIAGPEQFVVVSAAEDPEDHLWLGKSLPERRFELLTARGPAETEFTCREHQPDLLLLSFRPDSELTSQVVRRVRTNPLTRYLRLALVVPEDGLAIRLTAARLGAVAVVPKTASPTEVAGLVQVAILSSVDFPDEALGEASMAELTDLLVGELRAELRSIRTVVGDVQVPVGGLLGSVLKDTSARLGQGVEGALGGGLAAPSEEEEDSTAPMKLPYEGKRALLLESDRLRRSALARELAEIGLEVLPPVPDLTKALESGLAWAPDVLVGGAPEHDAQMCARILRRDIALSSLLWVQLRWDFGDREWPDPRADAAAQRPFLRRRLAEAFAPMHRLENDLAASGEVTGRVESFGMPTLLRLALERRPDSLLEAAEGTDTFKAFVGGGQLRDVHWIEADGTVTQGLEGFVRLLGVRRGRFALTALTTPPEAALPGTLGELLAAACHWWRPLALKVDRRLNDIQPLELIPRRAAELRRGAAKPMRLVVKSLESGKAPAEVVSEGAPAALVSSAIRELARRLAVSALPTGEEGPDDTVTNA